MASRKQVLEFSILACFCLLFFSFQSCAATEDSANGFNPSLASAEKITLSLYYESLCPYCASFIVNELVKVFETDLESIVNLRLVPWGNTQITPNNSWICQHGRDECLLDMVEACAINVWPNPHFKFIRCVEDLHLKNMHNKWQFCFGALGLSQTPIKNCVSTGLAVRDYQRFVGYICRSYRGNYVPEACKSQAFEFVSPRAVSSSQVCNAGNNSNITSLGPPRNRQGKK